MPSEVVSPADMSISPPVSPEVEFVMGNVSPSDQEGFGSIHPIARRFVSHVAVKMRERFNKEYHPPHEELIDPLKKQSIDWWSNIPDLSIEQREAWHAVIETINGIYDRKHYLDLMPYLSLSRDVALQAYLRRIKFRASREYLFEQKSMVVTNGLWSLMRFLSTPSPTLTADEALDFPQMHQFRALGAASSWSDDVFFEHAAYLSKLLLSLPFEDLESEFIRSRASGGVLKLEETIQNCMATILLTAEYEVTQCHEIPTYFSQILSRYPEVLNGWVQYLPNLQRKLGLVPKDVVAGVLENILDRNKRSTSSHNMYKSILVDPGERFLNFLRPDYLSIHRADCDHWINNQSDVALQKYILKKVTYGIAHYASSLLPILELLLENKRYRDQFDFILPPLPEEANSSTPCRITRFLYYFTIFYGPDSQRAKAPLTSPENILEYSTQYREERDFDEILEVIISRSSMETLASMFKEWGVFPKKAVHGFSHQSYGAMLLLRRLKNRNKDDIFSGNDRGVDYIEKLRLRMLYSVCPHPDSKFTYPRQFVSEVFNGYRHLPDKIAVTLVSVYSDGTPPNRFVGNFSSSIYRYEQMEELHDFLNKTRPSSDGFGVECLVGFPDIQLMLVPTHSVVLFDFNSKSAKVEHNLRGSENVLKNTFHKKIAPVLHKVDACLELIDSDNPPLRVLDFRSRANAGMTSQRDLIKLLGASELNADQIQLPAGEQEKQSFIAALLRQAGFITGFADVFEMESDRMLIKKSTELVVIFPLFTAKRDKINFVLTLTEIRNIFDSEMSRGASDISLKSNRPLPATGLNAPHATNPKDMPDGLFSVSSSQPAAIPSFLGVSVSSDFENNAPMQKRITRPHVIKQNELTVTACTSETVAFEDFPAPMDYYRHQQVSPQSFSYAQTGQLREDIQDIHPEPPRQVPEECLRPEVNAKLIEETYFQQGNPVETASVEDKIYFLLKIIRDHFHYDGKQFEEEAHRKFCELYADFTEHRHDSYWKHIHDQRRKTSNGRYRGICNEIGFVTVQLARYLGIPAVYQRGYQVNRTTHKTGEPHLHPLLIVQSKDLNLVYLHLPFFAGTSSNRSEHDTPVEETQKVLSDTKFFGALMYVSQALLSIKEILFPSLKQPVIDLVATEHSKLVEPDIHYLYLPQTGLRIPSHLLLKDLNEIQKALPSIFPEAFSGNKDNLSKQAQKIVMLDATIEDVDSFLKDYFRIGVTQLWKTRVDSDEVFSEKYLQQKWLERFNNKLVTARSLMSGINLNIAPILNYWLDDLENRGISMRSIEYVDPHHPRNISE